MALWLQKNNELIPTDPLNRRPRPMFSMFRSAPFPEPVKASDGAWDPR